MISIFRNIQEKFSPQQWYITTFDISAYNIFFKIYFCQNYKFIYLDKFISFIRYYYSFLHTSFGCNIFFFVFYFIKNSNIIYIFKSFPINNTIFFEIIFSGINYKFFISLISGLIKIYSIVIFIFIIQFLCNELILIVNFRLCITQSTNPLSFSAIPHILYKCFHHPHRKNKFPLYNLFALRLLIGQYYFLNTHSVEILINDCEYLPTFYTKQSYIFNYIEINRAQTIRYCFRFHLNF